VDLVVLFTKGMHSEAAVASVTHLAVLRPLALTLQNGVGNAEILAAAFGADRVLMGTAHVPADLATPTRVVSHGFATVHLGGMTAAAHEHAAAVAALLEKGRFKLQVTREVEAAIWEKLAFNAALNATAMVTQSKNGDMNMRGGLRIAAAIVNETVAVAHARGLSLDADQIHRSVAQALVEHPHHEASMLQDRKAQRASEIESINGAICREGERLGVATPVTATLADLVRLIECRAASAVRSA
jgi:2-dehydropantoate 2-reductase